MNKAVSYLEQGFRIAFGIRPKLPKFLIFFVTSRCNSRCNHCFFWKDINGSKNELTFEEIKKLSLGLGKLSNLAISGGEPILREDLPEICELFYKNNGTGSIHVPTNGLNPEKISSVLAKILEKCNCKVSVAISIDGLKETHESIRGVKGNWDSVFVTYKSLVPLKKRYPNFKIFVNTVISNKNYKEFRELVELVKKEMPLLDGHGFDWIRGDPKNKDFSLPDLREVREMIPLLKNVRRYYSRKKRSLTDRMELSIRNYITDLKYDIIRTNTQVVPCRAGDMFAVVYPGGDVALCELLPAIGNLRKDDMETIWNSEKAEDQRKFIKAKSCHCTHGCFQPSNALLSLRSYPRILKNFIRG